MLSFIFKSKPNYINFGLLVYRLALGISMFYHGYLKYLSGAEGLYKVGAMLAPLGVPGGYEILGTMAAYAEMIGGVLIVIGLFTRIGSLLLIGTLAIATTLNLFLSSFITTLNLLHYVLPSVRNNSQQFILIFKTLYFL